MTLSGHALALSTTLRAEATACKPRVDWRGRVSFPISQASVLQGSLWAIASRGNNPVTGEAYLCAALDSGRRLGLALGVTGLSLSASRHGRT